MNAEEVQHYDHMAATRLSEIGYRRYLKAKSTSFTHQQAQVVRTTLKEFIDRWEARELQVSLMVRCAPMYASAANCEPTQNALQ